MSQRADMRVDYVSRFAVGMQSTAFSAPAAAESETTITSLQRFKE
jgi:hypothetical protein